MDSGDIIISTALASRGTDIGVSSNVQNMRAGGLHVLLTYLPRNSRVERQIWGRTGRKGQPGSYRQILCEELLIDQLGSIDNLKSEEDIKSTRDSIESNRVENLKLSLDDVLFKEKLFKTFCQELKHFENAIFKPTLNEKFLFEKQDELAEASITKLLNLLKSRKRKIDFEPCKQALKEKWAIWFSEQKLEDVPACKHQSYIEELKLLMKTTAEELMDGKCSNFYHLVSGAITRSITFGDKDPKFVLDTWNMIANVMNSEDKEMFGAPIFYQR